MSVELADPRLVVVLFAPLTGDNRDRAHTQLREIWYASASRLGLTEPIDASATPTDPPVQLDNLDGSGTRTVAARRAAAPPLREAWWDGERDVACLSVTLSRAGQPDLAWTQLLDEWTSAIAGLPQDALLGSAHILTALVAVDADGVEPADGRYAEAIATAVPDLVPATASWRYAATRTRDGLGIWPLTPGAPDSVLRRLAVLAPTDRDDQLGGLVWTRRLPPLIGYLLQAAKLQYQARVLRDDLQGLQRLRARANAVLRGLRALLDAADVPSRTQLHAAGRQLAGLQADESGLIEALIDVRRMRRSVQIGAANLAALAATIVGPTGEGGRLFGDDAAAAAALEQDLDDLAVYLDADSQRVNHFAALADREVTRRTELDTEGARRQQERFILTQTATVTATLLMLSAVSALRYQVPLPDPAKPAAITALGALALWLTTIAARLASHQPVGHPRGWRPAPVARGLAEAIACGGFLASVSWLIIELIADAVMQSLGIVVRHSAVAAVGFALGAAASAAAAALRINRSRVRPTTDPQSSRDR